MESRGHRTTALVRGLSRDLQRLPPSCFAYHIIVLTHFLSTQPPAVLCNGCNMICCVCGSGGSSHERRRCRQPSAAAKKNVEGPEETLECMCCGEADRDRDRDRQWPTHMHTRTHTHLRKRRETETGTEREVPS